MANITEEPIVTESAAAKVVVGRQTAIGGTWTVGARLVSRLIDLATMLVLARLLRPVDFGLVAIAMTMIYVIEAALELPVSQALIRLPVTTPAHYDTAFTLSLLRGLILSLTLCLISIPFAHFYADPRLIPLICVLGLAPAARGLVSPRLADYLKNLDFSRDFAIEFAGKVVAFVVAVVLALSFKTYWSIAAGTVVAPITTAIVSYILAPCRPRLSLAELPAFSGFLGWITAAQVISALNWQSDRLLLGKLTSRPALGLFTTANDVASIPLATIFGPILRPLLCAFALLKDDAKRLAASYQTSATAMVTLALPILVGESLIAEPAVRLLFGQKWLAAAPMLRWLAISLIPSLFAIPLGPLVMALNQTHIFVKRNSFELCVKIPLVVIGAIKFQFFGVIFARLISESATVLFCMIAVRKLVGLSVKDQVIAPWRSIASAAGMAVVVSLCIPQVSRINSVLPLFAATVLTVLLGAITYCGILWSLWLWAGSPNGIEAMVAGKISTFLRRPGNREAPQML
jgi:O-antigen/teichoic acid export membrane protein